MRHHVASNVLRGREGGMSRILVGSMMFALLALTNGAFAQVPGGMPGGGIGGPGGGMGGPGRPTMGGPPDDASPPSAPTEKPDAAARKAYKEAMKYLDKAKQLEASAASASTPDKKAKDLEKVGDDYN